jgi:hypothetical protein
MYPLWQFNGNATCIPPPSIPTTCCLGTTSKGGGPVWPGCSLPLDAYTPPPSTIIPSQLVNDQHLLMRITPHPLVLLGDSVAFQFFIALQCALRSSGCTITPVPFKGAQQRGRKLKFGPPRPHKKIGVSEVHNSTIHCPFLGNIQPSYMIFYKMSWPWINHSSLIFEYNPSTAIFIFKFDIHWTGEYDTHMMPWLDTHLTEPLFSSYFYHRHPKPNVVILEQLAQHFDSLHGEYSHAASKSPCSRMEITPYHHQRLSVLTSTLEAYNTPYTIAQTYNYSAQFFFLHPNNGDCTHYCYTPWFWDPIFGSVARAIPSQ